MKTRQHLRVNLPIPVRVKVADKEQEFRFTGLEDISWGGAFVLMDPPAAKGDRIIIQFGLAEENVSLELWATVVRARPRQESAPAGMGVQFDALDEDSRSLIQRLIHEELLALLRSVK